MNKKILTTAISLLFVSSVGAQRGNTRWTAEGISLNRPVPELRSASDGDVDYSDGVFIVNEDWYGHQNSTVNFLTNQGEWIYRAFQKENPGRELGCTTQFGTIYGNRFYFVSKQERDPGAKITGSRFAVCDASTMEVIKEFPYIATTTKTDKNGKETLISIADGRSYLPVDEHKGYIGTSNGIYVFDNDNLTIGGQIKGTGNPNDEGYGQLYYAQIGTMVRANDYIFAIHQQYGLLVIDPKTDTLVRTIKAPLEKDESGKEEQRGFGSIVLSKDGNLWISVAKDVQGLGAAMNYMLKLSPYTFEMERVYFPEGIEYIPNSWYAWTADGFCASTKENKIYWNGYPPTQGSWFTGYRIYCYDIDKKQFSMVYDVTKMPGNWRLYGTGFRIHPVTDDLYCFLYHEFQDPTHELARISSTGELRNEYSMIQNYWFPAIPVFPDNEAPVISSAMPEDIVLPGIREEYKLYLGDKVCDEDNMSVSIVKSVITCDNPLSAFVRNDSLVLKATDPVKEGNVTLQFNSNGKLVTHDLAVSTSGDVTSNENMEPTEDIRVFLSGNNLSVVGENIQKIKIYSQTGAKVLERMLASGDAVPVGHLTSGVYIICVEQSNDRITRKILLP